MAIRNFRWGPCPHCKAEGWESAATRGRGLKDHDRPQGGRCLLASGSRTFPVGARVLIDGLDEAVVAQVFPEGSSSLLAPHYKVRFVGGRPGEQVAVAMSRVGVRPAKGGER